MQEFFTRRKLSITAYLEEFVAVRRNELIQISSEGELVIDRLLDYTREGKMIRGGLVGLNEGLYSGECGLEADKLGAVMELFQSALLVHDDIMDRDPMRRGKPAMHMQFSRDLEKSGASSPLQTGESLGICVGDIAFFLGYEILSSVQTTEETLRRLFALFSREMTGVGLGQMQDIRSGAADDTPELEDIYRLYINKTGRYTFSLPMMAGALLGGAGKDQLATLSRLGEVLGIIFQIKDDELGLFGSEATIGKPVGTDLSEGKQTVFFAGLMSRIPIDEQQRLRKLRGVSAVPVSEVEFVQRRLKETGVLDDVYAQLGKLQQQALELLKELPEGNTEYSDLMHRFVDYNLKRTV